MSVKVSDHNKELILRAQGIARRLWGFLPLSGSGLALCLVLVGVTIVFGLRRSDHVLLLSGITVGVLALLDIFMVTITAAYIAVKFRKQSLENSRQRLRLVTGHPSPGQRRLGRWLPPLVEGRTQILHPSDFECFWKREPDGSRQEWITPGRRCELEENFLMKRRVIVNDVLGFSTIDWESSEPISITVVPPPLPIPSYSLIRAWFLGDDHPDPRGEPQGDRVDMRQYAHGDPPRLLLWNIYARTGKLMVRVPEAAVATAPRTCAYLVAGPGDEPVASLARTMVENRLLGEGWRFGADGSPTSVTQAEEALRVIARSGNPGVRSGDGLPAFLEEAARLGFGSCILLLPPGGGTWNDSVASALLHSPISVSLLTVASLRQTNREPDWHRWVFYEEKTSTNPQELFAGLTSSAVADWLVFDPEQQQLIPLRVKNESALGGRS